jgi:hypothetical protein
MSCSTETIDRLEGEWEASFSNEYYSSGDTIVRDQHYNRRMNIMFCDTVAFYVNTGYAEPRVIVKYKYQNTSDSLFFWWEKKIL